jgi:hypothetical protein
MRRLRQHLRVALLVLGWLRGLMSRRSLGLRIRLGRRGLRLHLDLPETRLAHDLRICSLHAVQLTRYIVPTLSHVLNAYTALLAAPPPPMTSAGRFW